MITEPQYWKTEILNCASSLRDKIDQKRWSSVSIGHLERMTMSACYGVRKLYESGYIDETKFHEPIQLRNHPTLGKGITSENWRDIDLYYDLKNSYVEDHKFSFLCNQFIHSFVFIPVLKGGSDNGLQGIAFNSDRSKKNSLYYVEIWKLIDALAKSGDGYIGRPTIFNVGSNGELTLSDNQNG